MKQFIVSTAAAALAIAAVIITPLAFDSRPARLLLLAIMGMTALGAFAEAAFCHGRHCRRHGGLIGSEARHVAL